MLIPIDEIKIEDRIREDMGNKEEWGLFVASFTKHGQLQPIRVERQNGAYRLIAGERRIKAIKFLHEEGKTVRGVPPGMIEATFGETVPLHTKLLQEFAENNDRKDFSYVEKAKFIRKFHEMMQLEHGKDLWTQDMTAASLNLSPASISHYLRVEEAIKNSPTVAKASTLEAAVKRMKVEESLKKRHEAAKAHDNNAFQRATAIAHCGDAREWIKGIADESVDLVNFDPPWGDNTSRKSNHDGFEDDTETADRLMADMLPQLYRVLKNDRFCIFWHRLWATERMAALAENVGFNLLYTRTPSLWIKVDKVSDQLRAPERQLIEGYEPFFFLRKGDPVFQQRGRSNCFPYARVPLGGIIHPTEKPIALCDDLIKLCTTSGELVIDPTAGSFSFPDAALRASRKVQACELKENYYNRGVTRIAEYLKTFTES